jgi:hypothetical protein
VAAPCVTGDVGPSVVPGCGGTFVVNGGGEFVVPFVVVVNGGGVSYRLFKTLARKDG